MKTHDSDDRSLFMYLLSVIALFFYLYGFFPAENIVKCIEPVERLENHNAHICKNRLFEKLVLIVIDALRLDFVLPTTDDNNRFMPFTTSSITTNESCLVKVRAEAPTVTLPRLKAMTSGIVPTYFDVVTNFMSSEFNRDSLIHQANLKNFRIVFYGDETWIKLFPKSFIRSEGTTSFFASDYTEVDNNVTRHLAEEFNKRDWDFLILHYLGLDHIGHMEGPKSALVQPKLKEMDSIIFEINQNLKAMEEDGIKTLFLLTSDHGMKDSGGHGGVSQPEIILPLVSIGKACNHIPGWPENYVAEQVDLPPTISTAFGIPTPSSSIGKIIPNLLTGMDLEDVFVALELNKKALESRTESQENGINTERTDESVESSSETGRKYYKALTRLSDGLRRVSNFNVIYLIASTLSMWVLLIVLILTVTRKCCYPVRRTEYFLIIGTFLYGLSLASTSMIEEEHQTWYFLWVTLCILAVIETISEKRKRLYEKIKDTLPWFAVVCSHRILRKLNQTGDKWAMIPDIKSFLNSEENRYLLIWIYLSAVVALFWCALNDGCTKSELHIFSSALLTNIYYRILVSNTHSGVMSNKSSEKWICAVYWILTITFSIQSARRKKSAYLAWALVAGILLKPHNVILLPVEIVISKEINKLFGKTKNRLWKSIAHFWMGNVFYFYQGNGNSIANIDVSAGFVGLEEYNPLYSALMIAAHTNSSHVLSFLLSPQWNLATATLQLIPLTLYCTFLIFQLNHLFIWSVFSPKLLYQANFSIIFLLLMILKSLITAIFLMTGYYFVKQKKIK